MAGKSLFIGHGALDPFISTAEIDVARDYFTALGVTVSLHKYQIPHVVSQQEVRDIEQWLAALLLSK